jgi:FKBP-type peptidyl-prolyl cis-trans isomerase (trigger factor)
MSGLDELSRALGKIEGSVDGLKEEVRRQGKEAKDERIRQGKKIDRIDATLTAHRLKIAGIAGTVSAGMTALWLWIKTQWGE